MGFDVTVWGAFFAGLVSFISPCVLPIVPPYLCYLAGVSLDQLTENEVYKGVTFENPNSGATKIGHVGISWTILFFGPLVPLIRGDWKWALIMLLVGIPTLGLSYIVFMIIYNKLHIKDLVSSGFFVTSLAEEDVDNIVEILGKKLNPDNVQIVLGNRNKGAAVRVFFAALAFVLGFSTVFIALGATASIIGKTVAQHLDTLSIVAGIVIIIMGLHFLGIFKISMLYREARVQVTRKPAGLLGSYLVGLAFAFGWTPCVGPVLAAILFVASAEDSAMRGATLLFSYSMGIGLPFLFAALFAGPFLSFMGRFKKHMGTVEKFMGGTLVITGVMFATGQMSRVSAWMLDTFPGFSTLLL